MKSPLVPVIAFAVIFLGAPASSRAEAAASAPAGSGKPAAPAAEKSPAAAKPATKPAETPASGSAEVQRLVREFGEQRSDILDERKVLLERLRAAKTEEAKQAVLAEIRQLQQQRLDKQREVARQIREQMQNRRTENRPGGPGG